MIPSVIPRSALVAWGRIPPPDLAYVVINERGDRHIVTWPEVMETRRKRQAERMKLVQRTVYRRAYRFSVRYFDMPIMGGWQSALDDWRGPSHGIWPDRDLKWFRPMIMEAIPLGLLPLGSENDQWAAFKVEFAHRFRRRMRDGRPMGAAYIWWTGQYDKPELIRSLIYRGPND